MKLILEPIKLNEDKTNTEFSSEDSQLTLKMWEEYYPKIGYHFPWVGYFIKLDAIIVGSCAFTGPPVITEQKYLTGHTNSMRDKA